MNQLVLFIGSIILAAVGGIKDLESFVAAGAILLIMGLASTKD